MEVKNMKKKISLIVSLGLVFSVVLSSCGSKDVVENEEVKNSTEIGELVLQNFAQAHIDKDIDTICEVSAPEELWKYVCDDSGLSRETLIYKMRGGEDKFNKSSDHWTEYFEEENRDISDFKITEETESGKELYTKLNKAMKLSDISATVEESYNVKSNYIDGVVYEINGEWYYCTDWLIEDLLDIVCNGYDNWES